MCNADTILPHFYICMWHFLLCLQSSWPCSLVSHTAQFWHTYSNSFFFNLIRQRFRKLYFILWRCSDLDICCLFFHLCWCSFPSSKMYLINRFYWYIFINLHFYFGRFFNVGFVLSQSMMCVPVIVNVFATWLRHVKLPGHWSKVCYDQLSLNYWHHW